MECSLGYRRPSRGGVMIIAIDGPAGSGKSTIAREVAKRLGMRYLDTGAMYRTITLLALEAGLVPESLPAAAALAAATPLRFEARSDDLTRVFVGEREVTDEIRGRVVSQHVSAVSAEPGVRTVLSQKQREEAARGDVVLEGRDIGTVVVPGADVKVFLTASIEERARRRRLQLEAQGIAQPLDELVADIAARDAHDSGRAVAPLRKAEDAVEIDTTGMSIEQVIGVVSALAEEKRAAAVLAVTRPAAEAPPGKWPISRLVRSPLDNWLYRLAYGIIPPLCRVAFRMKIVGVEHFPPTGAVVVACNHRSNLDPFFLGSACPREIHFMAKAELWKFKPVGWLVSMVGTFPVNRGEADRRAVKRALEILSGGAILGLFPEGHRQRERELGDIRPGVTLFSLREGVVTIPVVLENTDQVVRNHFLRLPRVVVRFGPPLEVPHRHLPHAERALVASERLVEAMGNLLHASAESS
ncbi:MAG: cytidylate kinase [Actinobacteria bacterium RBG_16_64_13]|nr:MAG: cytidylate kinase [Actinobacteria bacterium RBG_16_64_13]